MIGEQRRDESDRADAFVPQTPCERLSDAGAHGRMRIGDELVEVPADERRPGSVNVVDEQVAESDRRSAACGIEPNAVESGERAVLVVVGRGEWRRVARTRRGARQGDLKDQCDDALWHVSLDDSTERVRDPALQLGAVGARCGVLDRREDRFGLESLVAFAEPNQHLFEVDGVELVVDLDRQAREAHGILFGPFAELVGQLAGAAIKEARPA